jgi:hypothetical protein
MDGFFHSLIAARIIFIFSITNIILGLMVFLSCRCIPGYKFTHGILQNKVYLRFYRLHGYIWLLFLASVLVHAVFAIGFMGLPA